MPGVSVSSGGAYRLMDRPEVADVVETYALDLLDDASAMVTAISPERDSPDKLGRGEPRK